MIVFSKLNDYFTPIRSQDNLIIKYKKQTRNMKTIIQIYLLYSLFNVCFLQIVTDKIAGMSCSLPDDIDCVFLMVTKHENSLFIFNSEIYATSVPYDDASFSRTNIAVKQPHNKYKKEHFVFKRNENNELTTIYYRYNEDANSYLGTIDFVNSPESSKQYLLFSIKGNSLNSQIIQLQNSKFLVSEIYNNALHLHLIYLNQKDELIKDFVSVGANYLIQFQNGYITFFIQNKVDKFLDIFLYDENMNASLQEKNSFSNFKHYSLNELTVLETKENSFIMCFHDEKDKVIRCNKGKHIITNMIIEDSSFQKVLLYKCNNQFFIQGILNSGIAVLCCYSNELPDPLIGDNLSIVIINYDLFQRGSIITKPFANELKMISLMILSSSKIAIGFEGLDTILNRRYPWTGIIDLPLCQTYNRDFATEVIKFQLFYENIGTNYIFDTLPSGATIFNLLDQKIVKNREYIATYSDFYMIRDNFNSPVLTVSFSYSVKSGDFYSLPCLYSVNIFNCDEGCNTCENKGIVYGIKCLSCSENYHFIETKESICISEANEEILKMYLDEKTDTYRSCPEHCESCSKSTINDSINCLTCNYPKKEWIDLSEPTIINCIDNCPDKYYLDADYKCKPCFMACQTCWELGDNTANKCKSCSNKHVLEIDTDSDYNCMDDCPHGFYSNNDNICQPCYYLCETCSELGDIDDHKCDTCITDYNLSPYKSNQCIKPCNTNNQYFYLNTNKNYACTNELKCPKLYPILEPTNGQCVNSCNSSECVECQTKALYNYLGTCIENCPEGFYFNEKKQKCKTVLNEINESIKFPSTGDTDILITNSNTSKAEVADSVNSTIDLILKNNSMSSSISIVQGEDYELIIYPSNVSLNDNMNNSNIGGVHLGDCENILRQKYHIPDTDIIYIAQMIYKKNSLNNQIQYDVYDKNGNKLDLSYCDEVQIEIDQPIHLNDSEWKTAEELKKLGIDIFDVESDFYCDICFPFQVDGEDLTLQERRNKYYNNVSTCNKGCTYNEMDYETKTAKCMCNVKENKKGISSLIEESDLFSSITSALPLSNLDKFTCFNQFTKGILKIGSNAGAIMYIICPGLEIIFFFIFIIFQINILYAKLNKYIHHPPKKQKHFTNLEINEKGPESNNKMEKQTNSQRTNHIDSSLAIKNPNNLVNDAIQLVSTQLPEEIECSPDELNEESYQTSILMDKRGFWRSFIDILIEKQIIISTIATRDPLSLLFLRLFILIFILSVYFFLVAFFSSDSEVSDRNEASDNLNFLYILENEIQQSILASVVVLIIGKIFSIVLKLTSKIKGVYRDIEDSQIRNKELAKIIRSYKIKAICAFVFTFIMNCLMLYYCTIFCMIYNDIDNQLAWIQSGAISIGFNIFFSLLISLLIAILRIIGLRKNVK